MELYFTPTRDRLSSPVVIRPAETGDSSRLVHLEQKIFGDLPRVDSFTLSNPSIRSIWVAEDQTQRRLAGFAAVSLGVQWTSIQEITITPNQAQLTRLGILEDYRINPEIERTLLRTAIDNCIQKGMTGCVINHQYVQVDITLLRGYRFYNIPSEEREKTPNITMKVDELQNLFYRFAIEYTACSQEDRRIF